MNTTLVLSASASNTISSSPSSSRPRFTCSTCSEQFSTSFSLRRHERCSHGSRRRRLSSTGAVYGGMSSFDLFQIIGQLQRGGVPVSVPSFPPHPQPYEERRHTDGPYITICDEEERPRGRLSHYMEPMSQNVSWFPPPPPTPQVIEPEPESPIPETLLPSPTNDKPEQALIELSFDEESSYFSEVDVSEEDEEEDELSLGLEGLSWENPNLIMSPVIQPRYGVDLLSMSEERRDEIAGWVGGIGN